MLYYIRNGDILTDGSEIIVCPTNTQGPMGAGLAKEMADRWLGLAPAYKEACRRGNIVIGSSLFRYRVEDDYGTKLVICLPTKDLWRNSSQLLFVDLGLKQLKKELLAYEYEGAGLSVSLPALGCGLGRLEWHDVKDLIEKHLASMPEAYQIYVHLPR